MMVSRRGLYALRAVFHLARQYGRGPIHISEIAGAEEIPRKFLEAILVQLKQGGVIESRRGSSGGYSLRRRPDRVVVGDVIRFIEGPVRAVEGSDGTKGRKGRGGVFESLWDEVTKAVEQVYDRHTFQDLVDREDGTRGKDAGTYSI